MNIDWSLEYVDVDVMLILPCEIFHYYSHGNQKSHLPEHHELILGHMYQKLSIKELSQ